MHNPLDLLLHWHWTASSKYPLYYVSIRQEYTSCLQQQGAHVLENTHMVAGVIFIKCISDLTYSYSLQHSCNPECCHKLIDPANSLNMVINTCNNPCELYVQVSKLLMTISSEQKMYCDWPLRTTSSHLLSMLSKVPVVPSYSAHILGMGVVGTA